MLQSVEPLVLTGRIAPLGRDGKTSGIFKAVTPGPWRITPVGILGDQQADLKIHGGPQKALHQYPFDHHAVWQEVIGPHPLLGSPGAFGENLSTSGWDEQAVHIGDVVRFGSALLQVSQGRGPCWKLNARFELDDLAHRVQTAGRTGWYYRVLEEGVAEVGSLLVFVDRPQPDWPLARLIKLMYRDRHIGDLRLLAEMPELSETWQERARRRAESGGTA